MTREERKAALEVLRRFVDEGGSCQCHTHPPCAYCERLPEELCDVDRDDREGRAYDLIEEHEAVLNEDTNPATP